MNSYLLAVYFGIIVSSVGIVAILLFHFRHAISDLESRITGIWTNESKTLRILIYCNDSRFQGEIVWARDSYASALGSAIIRDMSLKHFSTGVGKYIDPMTRSQFKLRLNMRNPGKIIFRLFEKHSKGPVKVEEWSQVLHHSNPI